MLQRMLRLLLLDENNTDVALAEDRDMAACAIFLSVRTKRLLIGY